MTVQSVITKGYRALICEDSYTEVLVPLERFTVGCVSKAAIPLLSGHCFDSCGMQDVSSTCLLFLSGWPLQRVTASQANRHLDFLATMFMVHAIFLKSFVRDTTIRW